jgi:hypothetical protein
MEDQEQDQDLYTAWTNFNSEHLPRLVRLSFETLKRLCDLVSESPEAQARVNPNHLWDITSWVLDVATSVDPVIDYMPHVGAMVRLGQELHSQSGIDGFVFPDELIAHAIQFVDKV